MLFKRFFAAVRGAPMRALAVILALFGYLKRIIAPHVVNLGQANTVMVEDRILQRRQDPERGDVAAARRDGRNRSPRQHRL